MNVLTSRQLSPLLAISCRSTGAIMLLASLFNMLLVPWPYQFQEREWLLFRFITPIVDRGVIALLAIVLILGSCWIDSLGRENQPTRGSAQTSLPFWTFILSVLLSIFFMLMLVFHVVNLSQWRSERIASITEEAAQVESQLEQRINQLEQEKEFLGTLFQDPERRQQAIAQGQLSEQAIAVLENLDNNPDAFGAIEQQIEEFSTQGQTDINIRRQEAQKEVADRALKSGLMTGVDSLLLAVGFGIISWAGLRLSK